MEGTSRCGLGELLPPSAPVSAENERDEFQMSAETHPRHYSDASAPPSYEAALDASTGAPYPTSNPMGMPYPTGALESKNILPYPPVAEHGIHLLPTRKIGIVILPSSQIERGLPPPMQSAFSPPVTRTTTRDESVAVPPNTNSPTTLRVRSDNRIRHRELRCAFVVIAGFTILLIIIVSFVRGRPKNNSRPLL